MLCDEIERTGEVPATEHFLYRVVMPTMPDATIAEVREAVLLYISRIPANDDGPV